MRTFGQLSRLERIHALHRSQDILMNQLIEGVVIISMPNKLTQSQFDRILSDTRKNEIGTDVARQLLLQHVGIGKEISKLTVAIAEGSRYDNNGAFIF